MTITIKPKPGHRIELVDAADVDKSFAPIVDTAEGRLGLGGPWVHQLPSDGHPRNPGGLARRGMFGASVGQTDNVCVTVTWHHPEWYHVLAQIGPTIGISPGFRHDDRLGYQFVNDIALRGAGYMLQVFRSPPDDQLEPGRYKTGHGTSPALLPMGKTRTEITMTAHDGKLWVDWEGDTVLAAVDRPWFTKDRDCWGVHMIDIHPMIGAPSWEWTSSDGETIDGGDWTGPPVTHTGPGVSCDLRIEAL